MHAHRDAWAAGDFDVTVQLPNEQIQQFESHGGGFCEVDAGRQTGTVVGDAELDPTGIQGFAKLWILGIAHIRQSDGQRTVPGAQTVLENVPR